VEEKTEEKPLKTIVLDGTEWHFSATNSSV